MQVLELLINLWHAIEPYHSIVQFSLLLIVIVILLKLLEQSWLFYRQSIFKESIEWTLLELRIPREVHRTPRAMEQFFMNVHGMRNVASNMVEKYIDGEVTLWWSLEIVSRGGEVHFYIRTPKKHAKMVEAGMYAQYPTAEVVEVKDYVDDVPRTTEQVYEGGQNMFGSEFILGKEDVYPITTYEHFEKDKTELSIDPLSALLEVLGNIHKKEDVFLQILIRPTGSEWKEQARKFVDKLLGREEKKGGGTTAVDWARNFMNAPLEHPTWPEGMDKKEENSLFSMFKLSPGEQEVIKAIERDLAKPAFETLIRFLYVAPTTIFNVNFARRGMIGALNQYASQELNNFRTNYDMETRLQWIKFPYVFVRQRTEARKQRLLHNFRNRLMPEELKFGKAFTSHPLNLNFKSKLFVLSCAELATIYHIPGEEVLTAPHIKLAESKKLGPPAGLPIFQPEPETPHGEEKKE